VPEIGKQADDSFIAAGECVAPCPDSGIERGACRADAMSVWSWRFRYRIR
jgi:hypothetical protein